MFGDTSGNFLRDHSFTSFQFFPAGKQVKLIPRLKVPGEIPGISLDQSASIKTVT